MCHAGQYNKYRMKWSSSLLVRICVLQQWLMFTETAAACHKNIYSHPYGEKTDLDDGDHGGRNQGTALHEVLPEIKYHQTVFRCMFCVNIIIVRRRTAIN